MIENIVDYSNIKNSEETNDNLNINQKNNLILENNTEKLIEKNIKKEEDKSEEKCENNYNNMKIDTLKNITKDRKIKIPKNAKKKELIDLLLDDDIKNIHNKK